MKPTLYQRFREWNLQRKRRALYLRTAYRNQRRIFGRGRLEATARAIQALRDFHR